MFGWKIKPRTGVIVNRDDKIVSWACRLTNNWGLEIQPLPSTRIIGLSARWVSSKHDHRGLRLGISLFGYELDAQVYDGRHAGEYDSVL